MVTCMKSKNKTTEKILVGSRMKCTYPDPESCEHAMCTDCDSNEYTCMKTQVACSYKEYVPRHTVTIIKNKEKIRR